MWPRYKLTANTIHWLNAGLMLARRLRRRPNITPALGQRLVFAGISLLLLQLIGMWAMRVVSTLIMRKSSQTSVQQPTVWLYVLKLWNICVGKVYFMWTSLTGSAGPRVVVSTAVFHARARGSVPGRGGLKETKNVSFPSTCESQYCGEPPWPRGSVLGLRPPGLEFWILCLEDSVISFISPSSGGSPGPV